MRTKTSFCCAIAALICALWAQAQSSGPELAEISARGRALAEYDAAAWHGTDAVRALKPDKSKFSHYLALKTQGRWTVAFGRFDESQSRFLIVYDAQQGDLPAEFKAAEYDPPREDTNVYLRAAKAYVLARAAFFSEMKPERPHNISVLPAASGEWYVYAIPAQTDTAVLPFGGDVRYTVSADGATIVHKRQMHQTVLEEKTSETAEFGFHTHILSDVPEDSDVFYALTRKAGRGEWIGTRKYFYQISREGSLGYLGATAEVVKLLREGKFDVRGQSRSMVLTTISRLLEREARVPLEASTTLSGARCDGKAIWLTFSSTFRNTSDATVILHKEALQNAQVRFADTEADILADKFEKLIFFSLNADFRENGSFAVLGPGMSHSLEREYPILGLDLRGKSAVQFLFLTWPPGKENEADAQRVRWAEAGSLFTGTVATAPVPLKIAPGLLEKCAAK